MKTLSFSAKCSDCFGGTIYVDDNDTTIELEGYVPYNIGIGGSDYIEMKIDIETGQILNWDKDKIKQFIQEQQENEQD